MSRLQNSIVWSNFAATDPALSGTHVVEYSNVEHELTGPWLGPGNIDEDPLFVDGTGGRLQLGAGSKSIDAANYVLLQLDSFDVDQDGISFEVIDVDLAGRDRLVDDPTAPNTGVPAANPFLDMGAYERQ